MLKKILNTGFYCGLFWFAIFANYGFLDFYNFQKEITILNRKLTILTAQKEEFLRKIKAIRGPKIDIDTLEIQIRKLLAFARKNEKVYIWK